MCEGINANNWNVCYIDRSTNCLRVNKGRQEMFPKDSRDLENSTNCSCSFSTCTECVLLSITTKYGKLGIKIRERCFLSNCPVGLHETTAIVRQLINCRRKLEKGCSSQRKCLQSGLVSTKTYKYNREFETNF